MVKRTRHARRRRYMAVAVVVMPGLIGHPGSLLFSFPLLSSSTLVIEDPVSLLFPFFVRIKDSGFPLKTCGNDRRREIGHPACCFLCGVSPPRDEVLLFRQKDPKPLAPGRGPTGAFAPVPIAWASFDFRRVAPYAQDERIINPRSSVPHPFILSPSTALRTGVTEWSRRALRQSSPPIRVCGPGAQPHPQAPG